VFAGVCGGFAEYFDVDPIIMRIIFILLVLFGGSGILLYIAAIIIIPKEPYEIPGTTQQVASPAEPIKRQPANSRNWFGYILISIGAILLFANLGIFDFFDVLSDAFEFVFPVLLILLGMAIIYYRQSTGSNGQNPVNTQTGDGDRETPRTYRQFRRSYTDKKFAGVCGGLAKYFDIDPSIMRMLYVILCLASFGAGLVLYIILTLVVPYDYTLTT